MPQDTFTAGDTIILNIEFYKKHDPDEVWAELKNKVIKVIKAETVMPWKCICGEDYYHPEHKQDELCAPAREAIMHKQLVAVKVDGAKIYDSKGELFMFSGAWFKKL